MVEDTALDRWFSQERRVPVLFSPVHGTGTWPPTWLAPAAYGGQNFPNSGAEAAFEQFTWVVDGMLPLASITRRVAEMPELPWWHSKLAELVDRVPPPPRPPLAPDAPAKARHLSDEQLDYLWLTLHGYSGTVIAIAQGKSPAAVNRKISRAVKHMRSVDKHDAGRKAFGYRRDWTAEADEAAAAVFDRGRDRAGNRLGVTAVTLAASGRSTSNANSSNWTGRYTFQERREFIQRLVPVVRTELEYLISAVESRRFNDPETADALRLLRELHADLGLLIQALEVEVEGDLLARMAEKHSKLVKLIAEGAKLGIVAPALTVGISQILSALTGVPVDSTMVGAVWAGLATRPAVERLMRR